MGTMCVFFVVVVCVVVLLIKELGTLHKLIAQADSTFCKSVHFV